MSPRLPIRPGYILFEVMLAASIFAMAVVGLSLALNRMLDVGVEAAREERVRLGLESWLAQVRLAPATGEPMKKGSQSLGKDPDGTEYVRINEPLEFENVEKEPLAGLWKVTLEAQRKGEVAGSATLYVYRP